MASSKETNRETNIEAFERCGHKDEFENIKKVLIIYHKEDNDGVCSAAIMSSFLKKYCVEEPEIEFFGCNYAELSKIWNVYRDSLKDGRSSSTELFRWYTQFDKVFMVDVSFNEAEAMEDICDSLPAGDFIWCDHHAPILEESKNWRFGEDAYGVRRTDQSALLNTWQFMQQTFQSDAKCPGMFEMLSDYDSWTWKNKPLYQGTGKDTLFDLNGGVTFVSELNVEWFENIIGLVFNQSSMDGIISYCITNGFTINRFLKQQQHNAITEYGDKSWEVNEERACVLFDNDHYNSESFSELRGTDIKHAAVFKRLNNGEWVMYLYNINEDDELHCGNYCRENYGGGGHKGAAGCTLSEEQVMNMLKTHKI